MVPPIHREYPIPATQGSAHIFSHLAYGAITLYRGTFQCTSAHVQRCLNRPKHHIPHMSPYGIRFALYPFRSPLLRVSQLISFPADTKMLHFSALPFLIGIHPKVSEVLLGNLGIKDRMHLPRAFRRLPRPSSAPTSITVRTPGCISCVPFVAAVTSVTLCVAKSTSFLTLPVDVIESI